MQLLNIINTNSKHTLESQIMRKICCTMQPKVYNILDTGHNAKGKDWSE